MTQKDKELLLKDLSARLPYNPLISINGERYRMEEIRNALIGIDTYKITVDGCLIDSVKPYLFPLSSMTDEQLVIYGDLCYAIIHSLAWDTQAALNELVDWLNENHFDYNNLIPMGLANDCTNLNIY